MNIFDFASYREFLGRFYQEMKQRDALYSYKRFATQAKLGSPNYMKLVIDGKRNLTVSNIHQFARGLKLSFNETQYFETLVLFEQAKTASEKGYYQARLTLLKDQRPVKSRKVKLESLLENPLYLAILVCLDGQRVQDAVDVITKKTGASRAETERVIALLMAKDLLIAQNGRYVLSDQYYLFHDKTMTSATQKAYLRSQLKLSQQMLERRYEKGARFHSQTFTIANETLPFYQDRLATFIDELMEQTNKEVPDQVIQLNVQMFPFLEAKRDR